MCMIGCIYEKVYHGKEVCMRPEQCCKMYGPINCDPILDWIPSVSVDLLATGQRVIRREESDK